MEILKKIHLEFSKINESSLDTFLVGSQVKKYNSSHDFDIILIHNSNLSVDNSRQIIAEIRDIVKVLFPDLLISLKIFSLAEIEEFGHYDGFRLLSFINNNISLNNTKYLENGIPHLNISTFVNSIIIQIVYNYLKFLNQTDRSDRIRESCLKWYHVNNGLKTTHVGGIEKLITENSCLFKLYNAAISNDREFVKNFLPNYFKLIPHENINKFEVYMTQISIY